MNPPAFTPRNVTKFVAKAIIAYKTAKLAEDVITDYTRFEKDDMIVDIGTGVIGWYVSDKLEPITDKIVDKTADFIVAQRTKRQEKKIYTQPV